MGTLEEIISDNPGFLDSPSNEATPSGLLNRLDKDLNVDKGINASELADLLDDTKSEGDEVGVPGGDVVEDVEDKGQFQSENIFQNDKNSMQEPKLISEDKVNACLEEDQVERSGQVILEER